MIAPALKFLVALIFFSRIEFANALIWQPEKTTFLFLQLLYVRRRI